MTAAILAAKSAGAFLKKHFYDQKKVDESMKDFLRILPTEDDAKAVEAASSLKLSLIHISEPTRRS